MAPRQKERERESICRGGWKFRFSWTRIIAPIKNKLGDNQHEGRPECDHARPTSHAMASGRSPGGRECWPVGSRIIRLSVIFAASGRERWISSLARSRSPAVSLEREKDRSRSFRWNLVYVDVFAVLLREKNTVRLLKSTAKIVLQNRVIIWTNMEDQW